MNINENLIIKQIDDVINKFTRFRRKVRKYAGLISNYDEVHRNN